MTATATPLELPSPKCEARTGYTPGAFGFRPTPCDQTRGLRALVDNDGKVHYFCPAVGHGEAVAVSNGAIAQFTAMRPRVVFEGMD